MSLPREPHHSLACVFVAWMTDTWRGLQGEIFAAEGFAKCTGKVGVCIATSGPGATNLVTGLADAMLDSVPLVAITGQVTSPTACTPHAQHLSRNAAAPLLASIHGQVVQEEFTTVARCCSHRAVCTFSGSSRPLLRWYC